MKLNLNRPLVFFDLETTGLQIGSAYIVEISLVKVNVDGSVEEKTHRIRPARYVNRDGVEVAETLPIPPETTAVHHITDADVADKPTFRELAPEILAFIGDADIAGYNSNKFDVPLLVEEFLRNGINFDLANRYMVDVQNIFHKMEQRTLKAAYKFYCGKDLENAHSANADTMATYEIFLAQIERYKDVEYTDEKGKVSKPIVNDIPALSEFSRSRQWADLEGRIGIKNGVEVFNFGKHKDKPVKEVFRVEPSYYSWMMNGDFSLSTKQVITRIYQSLKAEKREAEKLDQLREKFNGGGQGKLF
ncbi:MAG: 3'-5' exonuclease [Bacteroidales bacterium]|nr:3'-5' exonuclease [Bacteroidales bacterium]MBR5028700.1 3'-5' exonuclease [Bacteroidales bacterium]